MALRFKKEATASDRARRDTLIGLMTHVRALLSGQEDAVVSVSDHVCSALGCRDEPQTTILILRPDQPARVFKIDKPITAVTQTDVSVALAPLLGREAVA
jgi:hypothetical protein